MKKRFSTLLLACSMLLVGAAGGVMTGCDDKVPPPPVYESNEKYEIGMWVGVPDVLITYDEGGKEIGSRALTDEEFLQKYREIAEAGFTVAMPSYKGMGNGGAYNYKALKAASQVGIKQIIADDTLRHLVINAKLHVEEQKIVTRQERVDAVRALLKPYRECEGADALKGFMIRDEPGADLFDDLAYGMEIFHEAAPDLMFYVNLFPVIATGYQLSGTSTAMTYKEYLGRWCAQLPDTYVSYDHYPLYGSGDGSTSIEGSFLYNMDLMQTEVRDEGQGRKIWTFLQSMSYGGRNRALRSKADASMQALSALAYGIDCIQWFCYSCPPPYDGATVFGNDAPLDRDLNKTAAYDYVKAANLDIQAMMPYYKNFTWKGVMLSDAYDETENFLYLEDSPNVLASNKTLTKLTSTEAAFTGVYEDKDGRQGFLVVNFTDPGKNLSNKVTMNLSGASAAIVIKNGEVTTTAVKKGKLELDFASGEGAFVIPY